jgi:hypothetical protein
MAVSNPKETDRGAILTRFILLYIVSILCAIIPLYYLFNIPEVAFSELKASKLSAKGQQEQIERFELIYSELDQQKDKNNFLNEYQNLALKLFNFAKDSVENTNPYKPLFVKVPGLYQDILKMNQQSADKELIEKLKGDVEKLTKEKEKVEEDLDDCKVELRVLQRTPK